MSVFGNLSSEGLEETQDRVGGYAPLETNVYEATIKAFYAGESAGGAKSVTLLADVGGREYRETIYVTNKKGENFFLNKDDRTKKVPLPGFVTAEDIALVCVEKTLSQLDFEDKVLNIYDVEAKREMPKSVKVAVELIGKKVLLGIVNQLENKSEKDSAGDYQPIAETRNINFIDKVFHFPSKITVVEARNELTEPKFYDAWAERNKGQVRDRRTIKDGEGGQSGRPGQKASTPPQSGQSAAPKKSLFGG